MSGWERGCPKSVPAVTRLRARPQRPHLRRGAQGQAGPRVPGVSGGCRKKGRETQCGCAHGEGECLGLYAAVFLGMESLLPLRVLATLGSLQTGMESASEQG